MDRKVDSFSINIDELEILCSRLKKEFGDNCEVSSIIEFKSRNETLTFSSASEIKRCDIDVRKITDFSIVLHGDRKYLKIYTPLGFPGFRSHVLSSSESKAWCAGINEVICHHLRKHRTWYHWIVAGKTRWSFMVIQFFSLHYLYDVIDGSESAMQWIATMLIISIIIILDTIIERLLPHAVVEIYRKDHDMKVIAIVIGVISIIVTIITSVASFLF